MPDYTTTALLNSIKTRAMVPTSQQTFGDPDILALATEELKLGVVPFMMKNRSEYFVTYSDTPIVSGTSTYSIPTRAIGGKIKGASLVDSAGNILPFPLIDKADLPFFNNSNGGGRFSFYFEGNDVVLVPTPTSTPNLSIRFSYYSRPGDLVQTTSAAQITSINSGANQVTVSSLPTSITTSTSVDFIKGRPGFELRGMDRTISLIASTTLTFSTSLPSSLAVNDWIALSEQSPIPQIPTELHPMLAQRTAIKILESLGDDQGLKLAQGKLQEMEQNALHLISPRSDANPKKLINRYSTLRSR